MKTGTNVSAGHTIGGHSIDVLNLAALVTLVSIIILLVMNAATDPDMIQAMPAIQAGLIAAGIVLLRQWKKGRNAERATRAGTAYRQLRGPVTQLLNAEGFAEALGRQTCHQTTSNNGLVVLCVSLDRLKDIQDRLGEACGDEVLRDLSNRLVSAFGEEGTVGRIGEDMLAVFHPSTSGIRLAIVGGQINRLMNMPVKTPAGDVMVPSTIGVNFADVPTNAPRDTIRQARLANSAARSSGSSIAFFDGSLDHAQRLQLDLEIELRQALLAGELQMVYQPQINENGTIIGVEALMRWPHPKRGQISPVVFVPLAEAVGLGGALGRFAIDQAFRDSVLWPGLKTAINLSPMQLRSPDFVGSVKALLAQHGVKPGNFEFEITEGILLEAKPTVLESLQQLRHLGFQIALDDFGTGYSSLSYLCQFPIDKIKIDRSFVTPLGERHDAISIIRAISDLSEALGLKVLAEGVETPAQLGMLRSQGCNQAQGYLIGRPVVPEKISELLNPARGPNEARVAA